MPAQILGPRVASKIDKERKAPRTFKDDRAVWDGIVTRGVRSVFGDNDLKPKKAAKLLGLNGYNVVNMDRGHRKIRAADLFLIAIALGETPMWLVEEILRRNKKHIERWKQKAGLE